MDHPYLHCFFTENETELFTIDRVTVNGVLYTDVSNNSKNCDSYIHHKNDYGSIEKIIINKDCIYFVCTRQIRLLSSFHYAKFPSVRSKIFTATRTEQTFICKIENVEKICFMHINDANIIFLCDFNISHLFH